MEKINTTGPSAGPQLEEPTPEEAPSTPPDVAKTTDTLTEAARASGASLPEVFEVAMKSAAEHHSPGEPAD